MRGPSRARLKTISTAAVAAVAVLALAAPANADPVRGHYVGHQPGTASKVKIKKGERNRELSTNLLRLKVGADKVLLTYCIEINTQVQRVGYREAGWNETTLGGNAKHINWILHHSYPYVGVDALAKQAGLSSAPSVRDAVAGTQAAIWHFSDGYDLRRGANRAVVEALYGYLTGSANTGMDNEPAPTLALSRENLSGEPGELLGPFKVATSAKQGATVALAGAPEGVTLLGPDKKTEVTTAKNGDKLWVSVPEDAADGSAKVTADVVGKVSPGRVFKGVAKKTQTLILAGSDEVKAHDEAVVSWADVPTAAPGSTSEPVCEEDAGVKITLSNEGDAPAEFTVSYGETSETETVKAGEAKWKVIPVEEDAAYKITVKSGDYEKVYEGVLNCAKDEPAPTTPAPGAGGDLPTTGFNNLTMFLGVGGGLLLVGLALLFLVRRRGQQAKA